MRCADCESEPLAPSRFCDCCGREVMLSEAEMPHVEAPLDVAPAKTAEAAAPNSSHEAAADLDDWAPTPGPISGLHCPSCNGPSADGNRCQPCRDLAADDPVEPETPSLVDASIRAAREIVENSAFSNAANPHHDGATVQKDKAASARATANEIVAKSEQTVRKPAIVDRRPVAPVVPAVSKPRHEHGSIALAAAAVAVGAVCLAAWYNVREKSVLVHEEQLAIVAAPPAAPEDVEPVKRSPAPVERPVAQTPAPKAVERSSPPAPSGAPKSSATTSGPAQKKAAPPPAKPAPFVWPPSSINKPAQSSDESSTVASAVPPKPTEVAEAAAKPEPVAVGRIFDTNEVNEAPRIQTRARPKLPVELRNRPLKEVVVVRALVSQSGLPTRISLLRRSKTGPQLDDVVVESVNRWTFSPARKKGEAVSCWFNFAVEVDGAE